MKLQRVFQVSPSPEAMTTLLAKKLHSGYTISNIPRKTFIKAYGEALGGADIAKAVHLRATHLSTKTEFIATRLMEYSHALTPGYIGTDSESEDALAAIENTVPNYTDLFGSPDICECEPCESVYGAAAYLVDLLQFLSVGSPDAKTPLAVLSERRPDLLYLPLTCENTDTLIPYVDLALEVMEYYTANSGLKDATTGEDFTGYDTGDATAEELRAAPQNFILGPIASSARPSTLSPSPTISRWMSSAPTATISR